jgi:chorismate mutase
MPQKAETPRSNGLDSIRAEIDSLDDALLELIERRLAAAAAVAASKSDAGDGQLWLRPRREAAIIARLAARAKQAPPTLIERVWRELMGFGLQAQVRTELVVHAADPAALAPALRRRFGSCAPIRRAANVAEALDAACCEHAVAIVGVDDVADDLPEELVAFDRIRDENGNVVAVAVGRIAPDEREGTA